MRRKAEEWKRALLDLIWPGSHVCPICGEPQEGGNVCLSCYRTLLRYRSTHGQCKRCGRFGVPTDGCNNCRHWLKSLDYVRSAWPYRDRYRDAIHRFKYGNRPWMAEALAREMVPLLPKEADVLVPVPLHPERARERGYNQCKLLAEELSYLSGIPFANCIRRVENTPHQVGLSRKERSENLAHAFATEPGCVKGKRVVLVDDVVTTGATMQACAKLLRMEGKAKSVCGVTLASGDVDSIK